MKNKPLTHADHIHQHEQEQEDKPAMTRGDNKFAVPQYNHENPVDGEVLREVKENAAKAVAQRAERMGAIDQKPMSLSTTSDEAIANFKQTALDQYLQVERDRACGFTPQMHDEPRPGHHHHTFNLSRDDVRKNRAAMLSREYNQQGSERDSLRHRCHAIINSMEHMEIDKEIALLALEHLVGKGKL